MRTLCLLAVLAVFGLAACRQAEVLPDPFTDAGLPGPEDAGPIPEGGIGGPCPCHPALEEHHLDDGGCLCRLKCEPNTPSPRCPGWEICATLQQQLPDGAVNPLDAGICIPAGAPGDPCSPAPCAETLICARIAQQDAGNTCRYTCLLDEDAGIEDATGADMIPTPGFCPPGQRCYAVSDNDGGACFVP